VEIQIRDPVHGFVTVRSKEAELLGTKPLQRLRGIRQLALASLVYPGAVHTRFDHTLGVLDVAGRMAKELDLREEDIQLIRYAALLHDVGHGPFSHVSEYALEKYARRDSLGPNQKKEKIHEAITSIIIRNDPEVVRVLGERDCQKVADLLADGYGEKVNQSVVSGPLDADKQDYLLRDSYFCGVEYGLFDLRQLHRSLTLHGKDSNRFLMLKPDGVHAVEQFVLAKYYLTTNVYRHKVRLITDQMIVRAIELGIDSDNIEILNELYAFDNSERFMQNYAEWDDARFFNEFGRNREFQGLKSNEILRRLEERRLFRRVFSDKPALFSAKTRERLSKIGLPESEASKRRLEVCVAEVLSRTTRQEVDPDYVIVHVFDIKSVKEMSRNDEAGILVASQPDPVFFEEKSSLFASINEGLKEEFVEVYAPICWDTRRDRETLLVASREPIQEAIEQALTTTESGVASS